MAVIAVVFTVVVVIVTFVIVKFAFTIIHTYLSVYLFLLFVSGLVGLFWNCMTGIKGNAFYKAGSYCLFPCLFQIVHHLLWVVCGILSEPYWATPIFLLECLCIASILYAIFLIEKVFVVNPKFGVESNKINTIMALIHLSVCLLSFVLILITIALMAVGNGHALDNPTAGIIESVLAFLFLWLAKRSNVHMLDN
jgi:hypothetical protein